MSRIELPGKSLSEPPIHGRNYVPFASMAGGWLGPLIMFWLYVWGPLRPFSYPGGELLPGAPFALLLAGCIALWWILPAAYYRVHEFERSGRIYEALGVRLFRRFVPDGDLANRWERRSNPYYRVIRGRQHAADFLPRTKQSERGHVVLLALGIVSAMFAWRLGWNGWAVYLSLGNVMVNLYPILLQRYTRGRLQAILRRHP
jgi:hypothetical protein